MVPQNIYVISCDVYCYILSQGQIATMFDPSKLEAVLSAIPEDLPSQNLCPWFRTVLVPFVRRVIPTGQVESKLLSPSVCGVMFSLVKALSLYPHRKSWRDGLSRGREIWS